MSLILHYFRKKVNSTKEEIIQFKQEDADIIGVKFWANSGIYIEHALKLVNYWNEKFPDVKFWIEHRWI
jgi:hypothetical protein